MRPIRVGKKEALGRAQRGPTIGHVGPRRVSIDVNGSAKYSALLHEFRRRDEEAPVPPRGEKPRPAPEVGPAAGSSPSSDDEREEAGEARAARLRSAPIPADWVKLDDGADSGNRAAVASITVAVLLFVIAWLACMFCTVLPHLPGWRRTVRRYWGNFQKLLPFWKRVGADPAAAAVNGNAGVEEVPLTEARRWRRGEALRRGPAGEGEEQEVEVADRSH